MASTSVSSDRDPLANIRFLNETEAKGMADSQLEYGLLQKVHSGNDPAWLLANSIAHDLGSDTTLFEASLSKEQEQLLLRSISYFSVRERRQDLLDFMLFGAASQVRSPVVFQALMVAGADPLRTGLSPKVFGSQEQGALVESLFQGNPGAAIAMLEKASSAQAKSFLSQWMGVKNQWEIDEPYASIAKSLKHTTTPARGLLPRGLPDFLNVLEQKIGSEKIMEELRIEVLHQYLRNCCVLQGHAWQHDVLMNLAGPLMAPGKSTLSALASKDAAEKEKIGNGHRSFSSMERLAKMALLSHCHPLLEVLGPVVCAHSKLTLGQWTAIRISTAIEQKDLHKDFPFNAANFGSVLDEMVDQGHGFVIDFEQEGKKSRYSALHDLAGHNGKNTFPHRMEKLLGLLDAGADPNVRNLSNQLPASLVKPVEERHQWRGVVHARKARAAAYDVLKEIDGLSP